VFDYSGRVRVLGILLAMLAFAALPAGAAAKAGHGGSRSTTQPTIRFQGTNGYRIKIRAHGQGDLFSFVSVTAKNGPVSVAYFVQGGLASDDSLDIHLPHVGRIAVEFDPTRTMRRRLPAGCTGRASIVERGYFRGTIELHGERDFTTVDRSSARCRMVRSFQKSCAGNASGAERWASANIAGKRTSLRSWQPV